MLTRCAHRRGYSIIEVLIALVLIGVLLGLGAPSFYEWIQNQQIRTATEAILNGLQVARSEAIRRNLPVWVTFKPPTSAWTVCEASVAPCDPTNPPASIIQSRAHEEGTPNVTIAITPAGATAVTFSSLGSVISNQDGSPSVTQIDVSSVALSGSAAKPLRVTVSGGGTVRMCDPSLAAPDPRAC